ncbi:hypothetical protein [Amycolatopsis sp. NBC_01480]|uniref:hypothetical protein n=1 Tax=Amycolatopsis sp. NBC_01480 TaxID=2903562 RepID=UPI002E2DEB92|nr:hypothetical protein [Amycolatopsis sp. NBC_01480]
MSRKNRTTRTATATDGDHCLHAVADVPGQPNAPSAEDKVWEALRDGPGSTTATVAMSAGVGRSTAAKILVRWERDGTAIRTAGDGPRNPDTWAFAPSDSGAATPDTEDSLPDATATPSDDDPTDHPSGTPDSTTEDPGIAEDPAADVDDTTTEDTTAVQEVTTGSEADDSDADSTTTATIDEAAPSAETDDTTPLPDTAPVDPMDHATETAPSPAEPPAVADPTGSASADTDRLPKGGLRALVEEYLTDHPGEDFGPAKIGKDLSRSGGAVNNACEKLVADGYAIKTCEAPKRFAINPDKTDVPETAGDTE